MRQWLEHLSHSTFNLSDIGNTPGTTHTLYIVMPDGLLDQQVRYVRVLTGVLLTLLKNRSEEQRSERVHFLADELPRLGGRIKVIADGFGTFRSYGIRLHAMMQTLGQLKRDYPDRWSSFLGNSWLQCFGINDLETAEYISKMIGDRVMGRTKNGDVASESLRHVLSAAELRTKYGKNSSKQLIFPTSGLSVRSHRLAYKRMKIDGQQFRDIGFTGLRGHYEF